MHDFIYLITAASMILSLIIVLPNSLDIKLLSTSQMSIDAQETRHVKREYRRNVYNKHFIVGLSDCCLIQCN